MRKSTISIILLLLLLMTMISPGCFSPRRGDEFYDGPPGMPPEGKGTFTVKEEYIVRLNAWVDVEEYTAYIPIVIDETGAPAPIMNNLKLDSSYFYDRTNFKIINTDHGLALRVDGTLWENNSGEIIMSANYQKSDYNTAKNDVLINLTYEPYENYFINGTALSLVKNITFPERPAENMSDRNLSTTISESYYYLDTTPDMPDDYYSQVYVWVQVRYRRTFTWTPYYPDMDTEGTVKLEHYGKSSLMARTEGWATMDLTLTQTLGL